MTIDVDHPRIESPKPDIKIVFNKETIEKFAQNSPTLNHLQKYHALSTVIKYCLSLPLISTILSFTISTNARLRTTLVDSPRSPYLVKIGYKHIQNVIWKFDELFNLLVLREGIDSLINESKTAHSGYVPGLWLLWFCIDYFANFTDTLLKEFIVKPFKLSQSKIASKGKENVICNGDVKELESPGSLRHIKELTTTTKTISKDIQDKINSNYITPTKDIAKKNYDNYIKPTTDKINTIYVDPTKKKINTQLDYFVKPTVDTAKSTYKTVSSKYEDNLNKSDSIPRAIVFTGIDIGSITIEKLKNTSKSNDAKDLKGKEGEIPSTFETFRD